MLDIGTWRLNGWFSTKSRGRPKGFKERKSSLLFIKQLSQGFEQVPPNAAFKSKNTKICNLKLKSNYLILFSIFPFLFLLLLYLFKKEPDVRIQLLLKQSSSFFIHPFIL